MSLAHRVLENIKRCSCKKVNEGAYYSLICLDADGDCKYAKFIKAHRSYGRGIPDDFQGGVYPGDEANVECTLLDDVCNQDDCPILKGEAEDENAYESGDEED